MNDDQLRPDRTDSDAAAERTRALPAPDTTPTTVLPGTDDVRTASAGTGTALLTDERIAPYLAAAEATLADLPPGERSELLEDLAAHLEEISAEEGAALSTRLGPPAEYAAELRASAGYPPAGRPHDRPGVIDRTSALVRTTWQGLTEWIRQVPGGTAALAVLTRLRPAWWVLRGWIAAYLIAGDRLLHSLGFGGLQPFLALVACLALSVAWGLRAERRGRALPIVERIVLLGLNAVAILMCLGGITGSGSLAYLGSSATSDYAPFAEPRGGRHDADVRPQRRMGVPADRHRCHRPSCVRDLPDHLRHGHRLRRRDHRRGLGSGQPDPDSRHRSRAQRPDRAGRPADRIHRAAGPGGGRPDLGGRGAAHHRRGADTDPQHDGWGDRRDG